MLTKPRIYSRRPASSGEITRIAGISVQLEEPGAVVELGHLVQLLLPSQHLCFAFYFGCGGGTGYSPCIPVGISHLYHQTHTALLSIIYHFIQFIVIFDDIFLIITTHYHTYPSPTPIYSSFLPTPRRCQPWSLPTRYPQISTTSACLETPAHSSPDAGPDEHAIKGCGRWHNRDLWFCGCRKNLQGWKPT